MLLLQEKNLGKYYAVINGHSKEARIFTTWDEAKKEVHGAKGALYKGFVTKHEAEAFLGIEHQKAEEKRESILEDNVKIYVDGSYELSTERYAYGLVVVKDGAEVYTDRKAFKGEYSAMRNVAGEVLGSITAINYAISQGYTKVEIYFDYQGIESWALGTWKRNNKLTMGYHAFFQEASQKVKVVFHKVKGHSGDVYNDRADELAKEAFFL